MFFKTLIIVLAVFFQAFSYSNACGVLEDFEVVKEFRNDNNTENISLLVDRGWFSDDYYLVKCDLTKDYYGSVYRLTEEAFKYVQEQDSFDEANKWRHWIRPSGIGFF